MTERILYALGLCLVILYLVLSFDDFIWDVFTVFRRIKTKKNDLDLNKVSSIPSKLLAVMIASWHEENVIEDVVENFLNSTIYPKSMYHIFLGVYPNDIETVEAALRLSEKHENIHVVINNKPGPTSKAQNINYIIKQIFEFEKQLDWKFSSFTVHDSEDVVHPYELKVTNYLIDKYPALQFPVFPIIYKPSFSNFFKTITTGTYADEFAENHFLVVRSRNDVGAFVPSAGTGFALSREVVESYDGKDILENGSLTEDYKLSLTLYQTNYPLHYVLERMPRVTDDYKIVWDYIATRSIFPNTFKAAVRQKTRWITGITMQSIKFTDIFRFKNMSFVAKYSLYRDQKAKVGNLLAFIGYPVFIYFIASWFIKLHPIYSKFTLSWYLSLLVTIIMIEQQIFRGMSIYNIYGLRSVFFSCLLPPIIPIRIVWGNIINFVATVKAYRRRFFGDPKNKKQEKNNKEIVKNKKALKWDKTEHSFLSQKALRRYHRKLGDVLTEKKFISAEKLKLCLNEMNSLQEKQMLGQYLLKTELITEEQLLLCISDTLNRVYVKTDNFYEYHISSLGFIFDEKKLRRYVAIPIIKTKDMVVLAISVETPMEIVDLVQDNNEITIEVCFATKQAILQGLEIIRKGKNEFRENSSPTIELLNQNKISYEQVLLAKNTSFNLNISESTALLNMGIDATKALENLEYTV